jgi:division protein CdvB (Snf7/Vps24/ESCRT-III family)
MADLPILLTVIGALSLLAALAGRARREQAALRAQVEGLRERLDQVHLRLEVAEQDLSMALSQTGVAEGLLLEKGIADADEVEDMRRRLVTDAEAPGQGDAIH